MSKRMWLLVLAALVASGCSTDTDPELQTQAITAEVLSVEPAVVLPSSTTTTTTVAPTTTSTTALPVCNAAELSFADSIPEAENLAARISTALDHPGFAGHDVSVSVWVDAWGEVATHNPDLALIPASNQKLLVAIAANEMLDLESSLITEIDFVDGDLVIRAAADPTLSFGALTAALQTALAETGPNIGRLIIDVSEFPQAPQPDGWLETHVPAYVGPLSGFMVENNRWTQSEQLVADPTLANGNRLLQVLDELGANVEGPAAVWRVEAPPEGETIATIESAPIGALVRTMLVSSDNQHADLLLLELGREYSGIGTINEGAKAVDNVLAEMCGSTDGIIDDGSGLSRENFRSSRSFVESLSAIHGTPEGDLLRSQLPVGGVSGTLSRRFGDTLTGRVQAKTGTVFSARTLTGWATMANGQDAIFSILVNGEPGTLSPSLSAIDAMVREILATGFVDLSSEDANAGDPVS